MRLMPSSKVASFQDRAERLRRGRAAAPVLREICPSATRLELRLEFLCEERSGHADQVFVMYPSARAFFGFPCPYGDCDGIYDLRPAVEATLGESTLQSTGAIECAGVRPRLRGPRQACRLQLNFSITSVRNAKIFASRAGVDHA